MNRVWKAPRTAILQEMERNMKNVDGPQSDLDKGISLYSLAASMAIRPEDEK